MVGCVMEMTARKSCKRGLTALKVWSSCSLLLEISVISVEGLL